MVKISKNKEIINHNIIQSIQNLESLKLPRYKKIIFDIFKICLGAIKNQNKIIFCGNGGSAADSQHLSAELVSKFLKIRKPLPAIALTTNTSTLTSISNDFGYEHIFSKQISALGKKGDVLIAISTSGKSKNVIETAFGRVFFYDFNIRKYPRSPHSSPQLFRTIQNLTLFSSPQPTITTAWPPTWGPFPFHL